MRSLEAFEICSDDRSRDYLFLWREIYLHSLLIMLIYIDILTLVSVAHGDTSSYGWCGWLPWRGIQADPSQIWLESNPKKCHKNNAHHQNQHFTREGLHGSSLYIPSSTLQNLYIQPAHTTNIPSSPSPHHSTTQSPNPPVCFSFPPQKSKNNPNQDLGTHTLYVCAPRSWVLLAECCTRHALIGLTWRKPAWVSLYVSTCSFTVRYARLWWGCFFGFFVGSPVLNFLIFLALNNCVLSWIIG